MTHFKNWIIETILNEFTEKEDNEDLGQKMKNFEKNLNKMSNWVVEYFWKQRKWRRMLHVLLFPAVFCYFIHPHVLLVLDTDRIFLNISSLILHNLTTKK